MRDVARPRSGHPPARSRAGGRHARHRARARLQVSARRDRRHDLSRALVRARRRRHPLAPPERGIAVAQDRARQDPPRQGAAPPREASRDAGRLLFEVSSPTMNPFSLRLLGGAASAVDRAFVAAMQMSNRRVRARAESLSHAERLESLARIEKTYCAPELFSDRSAFFPPPAPVAPSVRAVRELPWGGECVELSWTSAFQPFDAHVGERYLAHVPNRTAYTRL